MPELRDLAQQQAALIEKARVLHVLTLNLAKAQTTKEALYFLVHWQKPVRKNRRA